MQANAPTFSGQLQCSDQPGDSGRCTYELAQNPAHGDVYLARDGAWTYTGYVDVPSTCNSEYLLNAESMPEFCSFPQKYIGHGLGGSVLGTYDTFAEAKVACLGLNTCGGIVQRKKGSNVDCWNQCKQKSGLCEACDKGGIAGKCCRYQWNGGENGCLPSDGVAGQACLADPRWNEMDPWVYNYAGAIPSDPQASMLVGLVNAYLTQRLPSLAHWKIARIGGSTRAFTFRKDPSGIPSKLDGVVQLSQGYSPSYATVYKHHEIPHVKYEAECTSRNDGSSASMQW